MKNKKISLCLAGGGIKGVAHIGVLKAIEEKNIEIEYIGGTSSGSIVSSLYAAGFTAEEIYNIFDTGKFLDRPPLVAVSNTSGLAGIVHWINSYYHLTGERALSKNSILAAKVKEWVDEEYAGGRVTVLTDDELVAHIDEICDRYGIVL